MRGWERRCRLRDHAQLTRLALSPVGASPWSDEKCHCPNALTTLLASLFCTSRRQLCASVGSEVFGNGEMNLCILESNFPHLYSSIQVEASFDALPNYPSIDCKTLILRVWMADLISRSKTPDFDAIPSRALHLSNRNPATVWTRLRYSSNSHSRGLTYKVGSVRNSRSLGDPDTRNGQRNH
jgi:hypothetical protein